MNSNKNHTNSFDALTDEEKIELMEIKKIRDTNCSTTGFALFFTSNLSDFREFSEPEYALTKAEVIILSMLLAKISPIQLWNIYNSNTITVTKTRKTAICKQAGCSSKTFEKFISKMTSGGLFFAVPQAGRGVYQINPWLIANGSTQQIKWLKSKTTFPAANREKGFACRNCYKFEYDNDKNRKLSNAERREIEMLYDEERERQRSNRRRFTDIEIKEVIDNEG